MLTKICLLFLKTELYIYICCGKKKPQQFQIHTIVTSVNTLLLKNNYHIKNLNMKK